MIEEIYLVQYWGQILQDGKEVNSEHYITEPYESTSEEERWTAIALAYRWNTIMTIMIHVLRRADDT